MMDSVNVFARAPMTFEFNLPLSFSEMQKIADTLSQLSCFLISEALGKCDKNEYEGIWKQTTYYKSENEEFEFAFPYRGLDDETRQSRLGEVRNMEDIDYDIYMSPNQKGNTRIAVDMWITTPLSLSDFSDMGFHARLQEGFREDFLREIQKAANNVYEFYCANACERDGIIASEANLTDLHTAVSREIANCVQTATLDLSEYDDPTVEEKLPYWVEDMGHIDETFAEWEYEEGKDLGFYGNEERPLPWTTVDDFADEEKEPFDKE